MRKKYLSVIVCIAMTASLFAGCGKKDEGSDDTTPAPTTEAAPTTATTDPGTDDPEPAPEAGEIPEDYKYHFSFDEADNEDGITYAVKGTGTVDEIDDKLVRVNGVKGEGLYLDGTMGAKLDIKGVGDTYTVSFWVNPARNALYMPTVQFGPDIHGDLTGNEHWVNFTWGGWNLDDTTITPFPGFWSYDKASGGDRALINTNTTETNVNVWTNVVLTVDPTELTSDGNFIVAHLYANGEEITGPTADSIKIVKDTFKDSDNFEFLLGVNYWDTPMKGVFDEIYVYDYVVDAKAIAALYADGDPTAKYEAPVHDFVVEASENAEEVLGTTDLSLEAGTAFSSGVLIPDGATKIITLKNYSDGTDTKNNYKLLFNSTANEFGKDPAANEDNTEWAWVQADAIGEAEGVSSEDNKDKFDFKWSWTSWPVWLNTTMKDATVTLKISRDGSTINISGEIIDYNKVSYTMSAAVQTALTDADDLYLSITGEKCYIEILAVEDPLKIEADPDAIAAIGTTDLLVGFWQEFTDAYELADGATKKIKLHNYSDGLNNWDNFVIAFSNVPTKAGNAPDGTDPASQFEDYAEYGVLRADSFGWGDGEFAFTTAPSWSDWEAWLADMMNADVEITITRNGGEITVDYTYTGSTGNTYTDTVVFTSTMTAESPVYFFFTNEKSYVEIFSVE